MCAEADWKRIGLLSSRRVDSSQQRGNDSMRAKHNVAQWNHSGVGTSLECGDCVHVTK